MEMKNQRENGFDKHIHEHGWANKERNFDTCILINQNGLIFFFFFCDKQNGLNKMLARITSLLRNNNSSSNQDACGLENEMEMLGMKY